MRRRVLLPCICGLLFWGPPAWAEEPPRQVTIIEPDLATCVVADALSSGVANAGRFSPDVVPSAAPSRESVLFRVDGEPQRLRVRGFGLRSMIGGDVLEPWPLPPRMVLPDLDELILGQSCDTITEAVVALIASVLTPTPTALEEREQERAGLAPGDRVGAVLDNARRQLSEQSELSAGVLSTELGLTLIVEDVRGSCRRGTWLDVQGREPRAGLSVPELEQHVLTCLEEQQLERQRRDAGPAALAAEEASERGRIELPPPTGAMVAGLGVAVGLFALARVQEPGPLLVYSALPAALGGTIGYAASPPWRDALWLAGYWVGMAGTSLVVGVRGGGAKPVLIGGFLTAGALGSAALSVLNAASADDGGAVAPTSGSVGIPAAVGGAMALLGLLVKGEGSNTLELATFGALAAVAPAIWLRFGAAGDEPARARRLGIGLGEHAVVLRLEGQL